MKTSTHKTIVYLKSESINEFLLVKKPFTTYTCRYGPVSLDLSVVISQTTGPGDTPHRRGSESGTGSLDCGSRGLVPDP